MGVRAGAIYRGAFMTGIGTRVVLTACAKTFPDGTQALRPTDLVVEPGEILALLGPSGCGKTTLLRLIAGLDRPDRGGAIAFDDDDVIAVPIERRSVGMVFQSYALFPNMNVRANVGYGLKIQGMPRAAREERVDAVLSLCRLKDLAERPVTALSGGQRQRVAVARAVAPRPRVLLLDEPLSALDAALRDRLRDELAQLLRTLSITAVFVTHDQTEAMAIADRVAVMRDGVVEQVDHPECLYRTPVNGFVAAFVGGANPLPGRIEGDRLVTLAGTLGLPQPAAEGATVFVRPEAISVCPPETAGLVGQVQTRTFLGTHYRIGVSGFGPDPLHVHVPASGAPQTGERIGLTFDPDRLFVFDP